MTHDIGVLACTVEQGYNRHEGSAMNTETVRQRLAAIDHPLRDAVARWEITIGTDDTGEPAIDVVVVLYDADIRRVWRQRNILRDLVRDRLREIAPERWPYVTFSAESEALNPEVAA